MLKMADTATELLPIWQKIGETDRKYSRTIFMEICRYIIALSHEHFYVFSEVSS